MQSVTVQLPEGVYRRLQRAAEIAGKPIDQIAAQSIQESLPPMLEVIPAKFRADLQTLERLGDTELWRVAHRTVDEKDQRRYRRLVKKKGLGALNDRDRTSLSDLRAEINRVMFRRGYAWMLLKLRGHRVPTLTELESRARPRPMCRQRCGDDFARRMDAAARIAGVRRQ